MGLGLNLPGRGRKDLENVAKRMQEMQSKLADLEDKEYEGKSGGSAVSITVNGKLEVSKVNISPDVIGDADSLPDLILTATNDALRQAIDEKESISQYATKGLDIQGLF